MTVEYAHGGGGIDGDSCTLQIPHGITFDPYAFRGTRPLREEPCSRFSKRIWSSRWGEGARRRTG